MVRNIASNVLGTILPSIAALLAVPVIIHSLGLSAFGVFSLQVAMLFFFGLTDLGISRAIVLLSFDDRFNSGTGWVRPYRVGVRYTLMMCGALCAATPLVLLLHYAHPQGVDLHDMMVSSALITVSAALMLFSLPQRAILEASEQFFRLNLIRGPTAASIFIAPIIAFQFDKSLTSAALSILLTRCVSTGVYFFCSGAAAVHFRGLGTFGDMPRAELVLLRKNFLRRASWLGLTNLLSLAINYVDRFVLGALQSTVAVGQFVIAQEVVTKLWIASGAVISAATPRLAMVKHQPDFELMKSTSRYLTRLMMLTGLFPALILMLFGEILLKLWLGKSFTQASVFPLQVMAAGVGLNNLSQVNFTLLQVFEGEFGGAMLQVFNLAFAGISLAVLIPKFGVNGAAYAFSLRLLADCFIGRHLLTRRHAAGAQLGVGYRSLTAVALVFGLILFFCARSGAV